MGNIKPDYSLVRDGVSLSEWLWRLVDEDRKTREGAGDALQAMHWGMPSAHTDFEDMAEFPDTVSQRVRFQDGIREAVNAATFDTAKFVRLLGAYKLALSEDWLRRVDEQMMYDDETGKRYEKLAGPLIDTMNNVEDQSEKERAQQRLARVTRAYMCSSCKEESDAFENAESVSSAGMYSTIVFDALSEELLSAPEILEALLDNSKLRYTALSALERIGQPGIEFAPRLINELNKAADPHHYDGAAALGSITRGNPEYVCEMIRRLDSESEENRASAASILYFMEQNVCDREEEIVELLIPMVENQIESYWAIRALASVGRNILHARKKLIEIASPRPPKMVTWEENHPDWKYDRVMHERGAAISAMRFLKEYPDECIPVLVDAIDTFEEFDPDQGYHGSFSRICDVLVEFGQHSAPAIEPLMAHINDEPEEIASDILDTLVAIGPAAKKTMTELHTYRNQYWQDMEDEKPPELGADDFDQDDDPIGWAMLRIMNS